MNRRDFLGRVAKFLGVAVAAPLVGEIAAMLPENAPEMEDGELSRAIGDLVNSTLADLGRPRFAQIAADLEKHVSLKSLLRANRISFGTKVAALGGEQEQQREVEEGASRDGTEMESR